MHNNLILIQNILAIMFLFYYIEIGFLNIAKEKLNNEL